MNYLIRRASKFLVGAGLVMIAWALVQLDWRPKASDPPMRIALADLVAMKNVPNQHVILEGFRFSDQTLELRDRHRNLIRVVALVSDGTGAAGSSESSVPILAALTPSRDVESRSRIQGMLTCHVDDTRFPVQVPLLLASVDPKADPAKCWYLVEGAHPEGWSPIFMKFGEGLVLLIAGTSLILIHSRG
jgi:hypothetical protein